MRGTKLRSVFFDAAGTLFDARQPVGSTYARIAREFGLNASDDAVTAGFRRAFVQAPELAFGTGKPANELRTLERQWWRAVVSQSFQGLGEFSNFDEFFAALFAYFADPANWKVDPAAVPTLTNLKERGILLGVISNFDYRLYQILENLGLKSLFDSITISSEAGYAKPRPEAFRAALERHRTSPEEAMHVGDSPHLDFEPALALGMRAVLVDCKFDEPATIKDRRAWLHSLAYLNKVTQVWEFA